MAQIYANENFPFPAVEELRRLGHNVLTMLETNQSNMALPDQEVLDYARKNNRILVTLNRRHFIRLHEESIDHAGMIVCSFDPDFLGLASRIHEAIEFEENFKGKLIRINRLPSQKKRSV